MPTFTLPIQVYWEDTDAGILSTTPTISATWSELVLRVASPIWVLANKARHQENGLLFVVADISIKYHQSAQLEDSLS